MRVSRQVFGLLAGLLVPMLAAAGATMAAEVVRGTGFVTMAKSNTFSGTGRRGPYNLYFRPGGFVSLYRGGKEADTGRWYVDQQDRVCIKWRQYQPTKTSCYTVLRDGSRVMFRGPDGKHRAQVRGSIAESTLKPNTR